jgi:hypothetical protein
LVTAWDSLSDGEQRIKALRGLAERIAVNRTVAGVHYPIDSWAGAALGRIVGQVVLNRAGAGGPLAELGYSAGDHDFFDEDQRDPAIAAAKGLTATGASVTLSAKPTFSWLWSGAVAEAQKA